MTRDGASWRDARDLAKVLYALKPVTIPDNLPQVRVTLPPPFKAGPIPASTFIDGRWRDAWHGLR